VAFRVVRIARENRVELGPRGDEITSREQRLRQDQASRRVVRNAPEPVPTERDRLGDPADLAVQVREGRKRE